ncbi:MAG: hypothetical protein ACOCVB_00735 [Bacillota bacterium]
MRARLFEDVKLDVGADADTFKMDKYRNALVYAEGEAADQTVTVLDGDGEEIGSIDLGDAETGYIDFTSTALNNTEEFELDLTADVNVVVLRSGSRYRPVEQEVDAEDVYEV